jgi:hypothetical protein
MYATSGPCDDQIFDCERMYSLIHKEILEAEKQGNCVLVGRGSAIALAGKPGCFHVFVYSTMAAKKEWFGRHFPDQAHRAEQEIIATDKRRAAVVKRYYNQEWCARGHYHMLLNACIGNQGMIEAALASTGLLASEPVSR